MTKAAGARSGGRIDKIGAPRDSCARSKVAQAVEWPGSKALHLLFTMNGDIARERKAKHGEIQMVVVDHDCCSRFEQFRARGSGAG
jgi:hypothetical protein